MSMPLPNTQPEGANSTVETATRRYCFKIYPTSKQAETLHRQRLMMADLWNALKQRVEDHNRGPFRPALAYRGLRGAKQRSLTYFDLTNEITGLRHACEEWAEIPAVTAHRVAKCLIDAYAAFYRRLKVGEPPGYPRWRRRDRETTIPLGTMNAAGWTFVHGGVSPLSWLLHYKSVTEIRDRATWIPARGHFPGAGVREVARDLPEGQRRRYRAGSGDMLRGRNADIIWRDGHWWLSICVEIESRRDPGRKPLTVRFDLVDCFARVAEPGQLGNMGVPESLIDFTELTDLDEKLDHSKSERDRRWPRQGRRSSEEEAALQAWITRDAAMAAYIARRRRNALHVWSSGIVARASDLTIVAPSIRAATRSAHGDEQRWGAEIDAVASLNRHILRQGAGAAVQMLCYKAAEAGIRCDVVNDDTPAIAVGQDLVLSGKTLRRARREHKRAEP